MSKLYTNDVKKVFRSVPRPDKGKLFVIDFGEFLVLRYREEEPLTDAEKFKFLSYMIHAQRQIEMRGVPCRVYGPDGQNFWDFKTREEYTSGTMEE